MPKTKASVIPPKLCGSITSIATSTAPKRNPPSTAPGRLPKPPTTQATNAFSTGSNPRWGSTAPRLAIMKTQAIPASSPEIINAIAKTRLARTPERRTISKSRDAARIARPSKVRFRNNIRSTITIKVVIASKSCRDDTLIPPKSNDHSKKYREVTAIGRGDTSSKKIFCSIIETPKAVSRPVVGSA